VPGCAVLDLFAGCGGLSRGLHSAGFEIAAAVEWDADACTSFAKAHPGTDLYEGDLAAIPLRHLRGAVDVVVGGPPCQPWSSGGKRLGAGDPRDGWPTFRRVLDEVRPAAFLAENVAGFAAGARRPAFVELLAELGRLGYDVDARVLNAADAGVPQRRARLIIVGLRTGGHFEFPEPSHGPGAAQAWRPARDVVGQAPLGSPNPSIVTYARSPDLRPNPHDGHVFNGGGRPIDLDQPAPTLLASMGGNKTPWVDTLGVVPAYHAHLRAGGAPRSGRVPGARRITVEEAAQLQSFPPGTELAGRRSSCYRQVGNAVPPRLAEVLGRRLLDQLA
jgi:DNA (cytosine-5)-methyltransferase 1